MNKTTLTNLLKNTILSISAIVALTACTFEVATKMSTADAESEKKAADLPIHKSTDENAFNQHIVWAINIGGDQYQGVDGITYEADHLTLSNPKEVIEKIKGSQDSELFKSYRSGNLTLQHPLDNGRYEVIFKFAEPEDIKVGERIFNVFAQDKVVIKHLDVKLARDGKNKSALVRAVNNVKVTDGKLILALKGEKGDPILSAIVVRKTTSTTVNTSTNTNKNWQLVWHDEFDYQGKPDPSKWNYDIWPAAKVNGEDQAYTDRLENVEVKDGKLVITAHKENYQNAKYTSGRIHSQGKGDFLYGRAEIRAKLPKGQGTWSAIWMLPSNPFKYATTCKQGDDWQGSATCDAWPNSGEIDIMEHVGYDMQRVHGTVHNEAYYWAKWEQRKASIEGETVDQAFHTYAMEWTPEHIIIFFDDTPYFFYKNEGTGWHSWPYDHPYHLILNLAIGGMWGRAGGPIDNSIFPASMEVDYVRVYKAIE